MNGFEIAAGVLMILACVVLTITILSQDSKGQGLSSVIMGGSDMMSGESRAHSKEARQVRLTRILAVAFFAITIVVNVVNAFAR